MRPFTSLLLAFAALTAVPLDAARLKELTSVEGVRENQLIGYGLVVGLAGTGDRNQTIFSAQSLANLLERMGVSVPGAKLRVNNMAAVMITASLPAFAQPGMRIDATVAAIGDATNLQGGVLVLTSLRGADNEVYAVAQGAVVTGGFSAGGSGNSQTVNHPTVGRAPGGATVERAAPAAPLKDVIRLQLRQPDFTTSARIAAAINAAFDEVAPPAEPENAGVVRVSIPPRFAGRSTQFLSEVESLTVEADPAARVVVNERTGTIVLGRDVRIRPVAILHGNLTVEIQTTYEVSQPGPMSQGTTEVVPQTSVTGKQDAARNIVLQQGATVEDLVRALASIGSTPRDVIAILQNLRNAGALDAELEVM